MARGPAGEAAFEFEGTRYTLVFDFAAIAEFEDATDRSIVDAFAELSSTTKTPKVSTLVHLIVSGLIKHHGAVDKDLVAAMVGDVGVMQALGISTTRSMPVDDGDAADPLVKAAKAPPKAGTGTKSSGRGAKRAKA